MICCQPGEYQEVPPSIACHGPVAELLGAAGMLQLLPARHRAQPAAELRPPQSCNMKHSSYHAGQCIKYDDAIDHSLATIQIHCISPGLLRCQHLMCRSAQRHGTGQYCAECRASSPQLRHKTCQQGSRTPCQTVAATLVGRHVTVTVSDTVCRSMVSVHFRASRASEYVRSSVCIIQHQSAFAVQCYAGIADGNKLGGSPVLQG